MIYSIQIHDAKQAAIPWWEDVGALNIDPAIEFKPGLNILWGPNGSGKSTVLSLMGRLFHCQQGYTPVVTDTSIRTLWEGVSPSDPMPMGVEPLHNGQPVCHFDPSHQVGLFGGSFDFDFIELGVNNCQARESSGQQTLRKMGSIFKVLVDKDVPNIYWKVQKSGRWEAAAVEIDAFLNQTHGDPEDAPTVLLDEPDRSMDIPLQAALWGKLQMFAKDFQIIVATHSVFALNIEGAHYVPLGAEGYMPWCRAQLRIATDPRVKDYIKEGVEFEREDKGGHTLHHIFRKKDGLKLGAASKIQDQWVAWTESGLFISGEVTRKEVAKKALLLSFAEPLPG